MKILMTADTVGGVWTYAVELTLALTAEGHEVALATMGAPLSDAQWAEVDGVPNLHVHESSYKLEWMDDPWEDVERAGQWLMRIRSDFAPDVVHLNNFVHGSLSWQVPTLVVGHSCVLSWWQDVKGEPAPDTWNRYRHEVTLGLQAADMVMAPTRAMLERLVRYYGPFSAAGVAPNGRSSGLFQPGAKEPLVFSAGRVWDEGKNIAALARAAAQVKWPVYVAGDFEGPNGAKSRFNNVRLLGKLAPQVIARWFAGASIYTLPAKYEPFGYSALEAALAGCALVVGDIPSLREVWADCALFVDPDDREGLADAINMLISDPWLRSTLAARARDRALEYNPHRMSQLYTDAYRDLLHEREMDEESVQDSSYSFKEDTSCV